MKIAFDDRAKFFKRKNFYIYGENLMIKNMLGETYGFMERDN